MEDQPTSFHHLEDSSNIDRFKFTKTLKSETDEQDKFKIFEAWLKDNGTKLDRLELRDYGDEVRGCHTKEEIGEEEIVINVPLKCLITVEMGKETEIGRTILESNIELDAPKHIFLMIFMLIDRKNPESFFKPYYDILPPTLSNMPIFWTAEELAYLEGSYILFQIEERKQAIEADYLAICGVCPSFPGVCSLLEFMWARMCVCSRNFGLIINGVRTAALVPYADMLNHYRPRETKWQFDDSLQGFTITTLQTIQSGAQIYDSYGQKCNHRFLLNYGFSVENNVEADGFCPNEVPILLQLDRSDPLFDQKCEFWARDAMLPSRRLRVCCSDNDNSRIMLALLRVIAADEVDFAFLTSISTPYHSIRDALIPLNVRNELRALQILEHLCIRDLEAFPQTLEDDLLRLAATEPPLALPPFSNHRHAVIQVKGEKEVLRFFLEFSRMAIRLLQFQSSDPRDLEREVEAHRPQYMFFQYAKSVILRLKLEERSQLLREREIRTHVDLSKPTVV